MRLPSAKTLLAFGFAAGLMFGRLGELPLVDPDEGRNAEVAREMGASGSLLVPTYNGMPYLDKPALYFLFVAASFAGFGHSELAARLPSTLFAMALLVVVYRFARREYGERAAGLAVVIAASMPLFLAFGRIVMFDMPLTFFLCAAIVCGYRAEETDGARRRRWYQAGAALSAGATLVKGPVGFILPFLVLSSFAVVERRKGVMRRLLAPSNLAIFMALVLPWFVGLSLSRPDFPYYGLVKESLERFTTPAYQRTGPVYYFVPVLLAACFTWSCLFPGGAVLAWRRRASFRRADRFLIVWALVVTLFFSISQSKLPGYVLPAAVALAMLLARLFDGALDRPRSDSARVVRWGMAVLLVASTTTGMAVFLDARSPDPLFSYFGEPGHDYLRARAYLPELLPTFVLLAIASAVALAVRRTRFSLGVFSMFPVCLLTVSFSGLESYAFAASSAGLAERVRSLDADARVGCLECYPTGLAFYLRQPLFVVTADGRETTSNYIPFYLAREAEWPCEAVPVSRLAGWLDARKSETLLLARRDRWPVLWRLAEARGLDVVTLGPEWRGLLVPPPSP
ncbi:MAG TPA: glycosyltransferase family 39 protein [Vicinamibacteria bacterium]|nr:glycosyltransferase family 39 protein [Vicinamibacteria bacterium]